jgi:hypothetical protein
LASSSSRTPNPDASSTADWGSVLVVGLSSFTISAVLLFSLMVLVDPYDRSDFGLVGITGVDDKTVTANVRKARNLRFDSAILSNSTQQLIDPGKLSEATDKRFVQLLVPGGTPPGLLAVLDFFLRHHRQRIGALVIVIDDPWCAHHTASEPNIPILALWR